jgi:exopolysaccharide production protein ExoQ
MPPQLALLLTVAFVLFLFRRDILEKPNVTGALWIPLLWMLISGSRFASQWLSLFGWSVGPVTLEEGSPVDEIVFFALIAAGAYVLRRRRIHVAEIVRNNGWLTAFFVYCFVSILWSDFPFVAFKRWIKIVGHPIMVLILFTEPDPMEAVVTLMRRCAYVLVPFSVLFIKYYPEWGRGFGEWGEVVDTGVTTNKNELGWLCFVLGFFFFWNLLQARRIGDRAARREELLLNACFLAMIWWLLLRAHSATSFVSLLVGMAIILFVGLPWVNKRFIGRYVLAGLLICTAAEAAFGISGNIINALGKDPTLTDRTEVWQDVIGIDTSPILGAGFESFWLGERRDKLWDKWWWHPNQAHNGYLEVYLNLGLVGLFMLGGLLIGIFWRMRRELVRNLEWGRFRLGFLIAIVVFNWTEATFKAVHLVWFVFYIIAMDYKQLGSKSFGPIRGAIGEIKERELVCERA